MTIQFLSSTMPGAPALSGTAGALTTLLKACLVDGFGLVTLDSLIVSGGIATATRAAGQPMLAGSKAVVAGATPSGLNGTKTVLSVGLNTFTYDATGISDQTATGTITAKVASLGWDSVFSATNLEVFRSPNVVSPRHYLRIDDSTGSYARARAYETMSDVNTGTNPYPTDAQANGGGFWSKSGSADATARAWFLVGDDRTFYFLPITGTFGGVYAHCHAAFGDIESLVPADAYGALLQCCESNLSIVNPTSHTTDLDYCTSASTANSGGSYLARPYTGIGTSLQTRRGVMYPTFTSVAAIRSGDANGGQYPNGADGSLNLTRLPLCELTSKTLRGYARGFYTCPQNVGPLTLSHADPVTGVTGLSGRTLRAFNSVAGVFFVDCTGPW